ncbi:MAG TPA: hypothetical protein VLV55_05680 [Rhizomicrobium sp.]|nr:hypothetical protein [Rhizomicrobium sp.]
MAKGEGGKKAGRADREAGEKKKKNPVMMEARKKFAKDLRAQGTPDDQMREKVRAHVKETIRPAMIEAKKAAIEKKLKGPERDKFIAESVRTKLGMEQKA